MRGVMGVLGSHVGGADIAPTWWDRLWPLLVTAFLTLLVFWFVQLVLVPRVEVRKRREDRWERDVLDLGQLLTFEYSEATNRLRHELWWESVITYRMGDVAAARREELQREHDGLMREAVDTYRGLDAKASWIAERVASLVPKSPHLMNLHVRVIGLSVHSLDNLAPMFRGQGTPVPTEDEIDAAAGAARDELAAVVKIVKSFAAHPPPRPRSAFDRMRSRGTRLWRRLTRR